MDYKNPRLDGYPFPTKPVPSAQRIVDVQTNRAMDQVRNEKDPTAKVKALNREAIVKERDLGDVRELNFTPKPKTPNAGSNSSF